MYKYNMSEKISRDAEDFFNSAIQEKKTALPEEDELLAVKTRFEEQLQEIRKQKVAAAEKLDLKKAADLGELIENIEVKIAEVTAKIKAREDAENANKDPEEEKVFKKLKGEEEEKPSSDYDHDKLVESTFSFLKKLDYANAENLLSKNSQLKRNLGNDLETLLKRLKENVGQYT